MNDEHDELYDTKISFPNSCVLQVNFGEFLDYAVEHEQRLEAAFKELDHNKDGMYLY